MLTSIHLFVEPAILALCEELRRAGLVADVQVTFICGEPDIRLVVCGSGDDVSVELLCFPPAHLAARYWDAVRVQPDLREVWRGPRRECRPSELVSFIDALLSACRRALTDRYEVLG